MHQQTREEINSEREKLIKVIVQIIVFWVVTLLCFGLTPIFQKNVLPLSSGLKEFGSR
jgi:hypothetical protein